MHYTAPAAAPVSSDYTDNKNGAYSDGPLFFDRPSLVSGENAAA